MKTKTIVEHDYPYHSAGRIWILPSLNIVELPDGTVGISGTEIRRVHRAIANSICGSPSVLTSDEFEFLTDVTRKPYNEVARAIGITPSALTRWMERGSKMPRLRSMFLKRWFWFQIFGEELADLEVSLHYLRDEDAFLRFARDQAIARDLTMEVKEKVA